MRRAAATGRDGNSAADRRGAERVFEEVLFLGRSARVLLRVIPLNRTGLRGVRRNSAACGR
jgi:hypothetical protein